MVFYVLTIFPEMILDGLNHSVIKRAVDSNLINVVPVNIRDYSENKHKKVDDYPYGGGPGMVLTAPPIYNAYKSVEKKAKKGTRIIYLTPQGKPYNQKKAVSLSKEEELILLCGH